MRKLLSSLLLLTLLFPATLSFANQRDVPNSFEAQKKMQKKQAKKLAKMQKKQERKNRKDQKKAAKDYKKLHPSTS